MSKQTAVEWLVQELKAHDFSPSDGMVKINIPLYLLEEKQSKALTMEREQIEQSYSDGLGNGCHYERGDASESVLDEKKYYEETYGKEASHEA